MTDRAIVKRAQGLLIAHKRSLTAAAIAMSLLAGRARADMAENFNEAAGEGKVVTEVKPKETPGWGQWDKNVGITGGFAGTYGDTPATFSVTCQVVKDAGRSGKPGDHAGSFQIAATNKGGGYAGVVLHAGEAPATDLAGLSASLWVKAPKDFPFVMYVEVAGQYEQRVEFTATGTGEWQQVGGALSSGKDNGLSAALKSSPKTRLALVVQVGAAQWTDGTAHELLIDDAVLNTTIK